MSNAWVVELISQMAAVWVSQPAAFLVAVGGGALIGQQISRLRYTGKIEALEERMKGKDDVIGMKDLMIQSQSEKLGGPAPPPPKGGSLETQVAPSTTAAEKEPLPKPARPQSIGFDNVNTQIAQQSNDRIRNALMSNRFKFVFNPLTGASKILSFSPNGTIGDGRNNNEARWRIVDGRLEILDGNGELYSRFILLKDDRSFHHTNDSDTRSIKGQFLSAVV